MDFGADIEPGLAQIEVKFVSHSSALQEAILEVRFVTFKKLYVRIHHTRPYPLSKI